MYDMLFFSFKNIISLDWRACSKHLSTTCHFDHIKKLLYEILYFEMLNFLFYPESCLPCLVMTQIKRNFLIILIKNKYYDNLTGEAIYLLKLKKVPKVDKCVWKIHNFYNKYQLPEGNPLSLDIKHNSINCIWRGKTTQIGNV